jgi:hypothetical protein
MDAPEEFDEVALNVLLAEGVDLPTALEASRRDSNSSKQGCVGVMILIVFAPLAIPLMLLCGVV